MKLSHRKIYNHRMRSAHSYTAFTLSENVSWPSGSSSGGAIIRFAHNAPHGAAPAQKQTVVTSAKLAMAEEAVCEGSQL